nr:MAG TPA: hypothetical protein [Caudoviricetes sp.]DAK58152.1 MAG TPA: hypothetical protein [Caudoviricetes sp.]DAZ26606.1 MAG TPA: hypothetical protein [Caudoviricetes sp.]
MFIHFSNKKNHDPQAYFILTNRDFFIYSGWSGET